MIFLPHYSPDLNPIEQVFAKPKMLLQKAEKPTAEDTWRSTDKRTEPPPKHN